MQYLTGIPQSAQQKLLLCIVMSGPENSGIMHHDLLENQTDDYAPAIKPFVHTTLTNIKQLSALL